MAEKVPYWGSLPYEKGSLKYTFATSRTVQLAIYAYVLISTVGGYIAMYLIYAPQTPLLGIWGSPERTLYRFFLSLLFYPPLFLWAFHYFFRRPMWCAPRGKYVPGKVFPLLSTYNVVVIALMASFCMALGWSLMSIVDLTMMSFTLPTAFFAVWPGALGSGLGNLLRVVFYGELGIAGLNIGAVPPALWDVADPAVAAVLAWNILEKNRRETGSNSILRCFLAGQCYVWVHWFLCVLLGNALTMPGVMALPWLLGSFTWFPVQASVTTTVAIMGSEAAIRTLEARAKR